MSEEKREILEYLLFDVLCGEEKGNPATTTKRESR